MTTKMTRRTFLKGAAAAAAAVSLSGLLTGCGGDQLADNEVQIGPFIVKVYGLDVALGTASGNDKGAITGKVKLRYDAGGSSWQGGSYNNMFKAVVVDANLTQVAPTGPFFVSDALVGKPFATEEKALKLSFPTDEARQNFLDGKPAVNDHYHQRHDRCAVPDETGRQQFCCHQDGRLIGSRTLCPGHSGKSARGFLSFCPGAEGWVWAIFPAM